MWTTGQVKNIRVFVQRTPEAVKKVSERTVVGRYIYFKCVMMLIDVVTCLEHSLIISKI